MNWLLIVVAAIFVMGMIIGLVRGALRIAVSLVATVLTIAIVVFVTPYVSEAIVALTPMDEILESQCVDAISKAMGGKESGKQLTEQQVRSIMNGAGVTEEELESYGITVEDIVNGKVDGEHLTQFGISASILNGHSSDNGENVSIDSAEIPRQIQISAIENSNLPEVFKELLLSNNNSEMYQKLGATTFVEYISKYFSRLIINIFAFFITFIIATIVIRAIVFALDIVTSLPGLGLINRLLGAALGAGVAFIVIELLFVIVTVLYTTSFGMNMMKMIDESTLLSIIYDHNIVMKLMTSIY